jgi:hypothetical protein
MACRIDVNEFERMAWREARRVGLEHVSVNQDGAAHPMIEVQFQWRTQRAVLHRKPIQALVDKSRQAKPIIRNLLRWAKEQGAR